MPYQVVPVLVGKKQNLEERQLTPRQKWALMAVAPELYLVCLTVRSYLSGGKQDPKKVVEMLDDAYQLTRDSIAPDRSGAKQRESQDRFDELFKPL